MNEDVKNETAVTMKTTRRPNRAERRMREKEFRSFVSKQRAFYRRLIEIEEAAEKAKGDKNV